MKLLSLLFLAFNVIVMYGQSILKDSILYDGEYREHIIHLPESFDVAKSYPLVFVLHGGGGNAEFTMNYTLFNETSNTNEFITVYPNGSPTGISISGGISRHWADGRTTTIPDEMGVNDVQYIDNLIDTIQGVYSIDLRKVYASGISNGGFMCQRLACELSNRIAAVATVAATFPDSLVSKCNPTPTSIMFVNGTSDSFVPTFTGGMLPFGAGGWVRSTDQAIELWQSNITCTDDVDSVDIPNTVLFDLSTVRKFTWSNCTDDNEIVLFKIFGGGHTWPQENPDLHVPLTGISNQDLNVNQEMWDFFEKHCKDLPLGIEQESFQNNGYNVYPNPFTNAIRITGNISNNALKVMIYDLQGRIVFQGQKNDLNTIQIDPGLKRGIYIMHLSDGLEEQSIRIIKK